MIAKNPGDVGAPFNRRRREFLRRHVCRQAQAADVLRESGEMFFERAADVQIAAPLRQQSFHGQRCLWIEGRFRYYSGSCHSSLGVGF